MNISNSKSLWETKTIKKLQRSKSVLLVIPKNFFIGLKSVVFWNFFLMQVLYCDFPLFFMISKVKLKQSNVLLELNPLIVFLELRANRKIV